MCVCSVMLIRSASVHEDNGGYFSWGVNFCYFVLDLVSPKFPPTKMSAFTVMLELACMEAIKARGVAKTIMEAWPTILSNNHYCYPADVFNSSGSQPMLFVYILYHSFSMIDCMYMLMWFGA